MKELIGFALIAASLVSIVANMKETKPASPVPWCWVFHDGYPIGLPCKYRKRITDV